MLSATLALLIAPIAGAPRDTVSLFPDRDATLIEPAPKDEEAANGGGDSFFAGRVGAMAGETLRRGLIHFDLSSIPRGSTITSVTLTVNGITGQPTPQPVTLHLTLADWSEGVGTPPGGSGLPPDVGDCTWSKRFWPDVPWTTPGGDFTANASASAEVPPFGPALFVSNAALVGNAQFWLDHPESNFGWTVLGDETLVQSVRRIGSREWVPDEKLGDLRPVLEVEYTPGVEGDLTGDGVVDGADITVLLGEWGPCAGCAADLSDDGVVDGADIAVLLGAWS